MIFLSEVFTTMCSALLFILYLTVTYFGQVNIDRPERFLITPYIVDSGGVLLSASKTGNEKSYQINSLPSMMKNALLVSEDRQFYFHSGVDWKARIAATMVNLKSGRIVRGASTISEQVVKMVHKRKRTFWTRWIEGVEAQFWLEKHFSKNQIMEFYINNVPFANGVNGVFSAANYYFGRDITTLDLPETLAIVVMLRSPAKLSIDNHPDRLKKSAMILAKRMLVLGIINQEDYDYLDKYDYRRRLNSNKNTQINMSRYHFVEYVKKTLGQYNYKHGVIRATLDNSLQTKVESIVLGRLDLLKKYNIHNAAAVIMDAKTGDILSWVSVGDKSEFIDSVLVHRQSASVMKPFLYAASFENGAGPNTIVEDLPMTESVGSGLHAIRNYSKEFYSKLPIKYALGNSLNIPTVHILHFVTPQKYMEYLKKLEFSDINPDYSYYGNGLGLGAIEVSLLDLVQAYSVFSNSGCYKKSRVITDGYSSLARIFSEKSVLQINGILSNKLMHIMEFGHQSVLNFPTETSVKTGTSTDYRDSWAVGFNNRYVVGVWMGNLDNTSMQGVTGSIGAAFALRSIFFELNKKNTAGTLLQKEPQFELNGSHELSILPQFVSDFPTGVLNIAVDPRIPVKYQAFRFSNRKANGTAVDWFLDGEPVYTSSDGQFIWPIQSGSHTLELIAKDDLQMYSRINIVVM